MMKKLPVKIWYNPYRVTTEIDVNGKCLGPADALRSLCDGKRLQEFVDEFIEATHRQLNRNGIDFIFHGTPYDADDFRRSLEAYKGRNKDCFSELQIMNAHCDSGGERVKKLRDLIEQSKRNPICKEYFDESLTELLDSALDRDFKIYVMATVSSGKSTVINALLGDELLPSSDGACTARITQISYTPDDQYFVADCYDCNKRVICSNQRVDLAKMQKWNNNDEVSSVCVRGPFAKSFTNNESRLVIIDTPGANSVINKDHGERTLDFIRSREPSMVLYIIDATKYDSEDDNNLLDKICEEIRAYSAIDENDWISRERFVFLVNKIDQCKDTTNMSDTLRMVREYLKGKGISSPIVLPCSARLDLLMRLEYNGRELGKWDSKHRKDFSESIKLFEEDFDFFDWLEKNLGTAFVERLKEKHYKHGVSGEGDIFCGIVVLEELIDDFLSKYALPARIKKVVDSFYRLDRQVGVTKKLQEVLENRKNIEKDSLQELKGSKSSYEQVKQKCDELCKRIDEKDSDIPGNKWDLVLEKSVAVDIVIDDFKKASKDFCSSNSTSEQTKETRDRFKDFLEEWQKKINEESIQLVNAIKELMNEREKEIERFIFDYDTKISEICERVFQSDDSFKQLSLELFQFTKIDLDLTAHADDIIVEEKVETKWYDFLFFWRTPKSQVKIDDSKMDGMATDFLSRVQQQVDEKKKHMIGCMDKAKRTLKEHMKSAFEKLKELEEKVKEYAQNHDECERQLHEQQRQLNWYNEFKRNLNAILDIEF